MVALFLDEVTPRNAPLMVSNIDNGRETYDRPGARRGTSRPRKRRARTACYCLARHSPDGRDARAGHP